MVGSLAEVLHQLTPAQQVSGNADQEVCCDHC